MQIAPNRLAAHLQQGLHSLYTVHGDEALLVQEAADAIRAAARTQGFGERSSHTVIGASFDWGEVLAAGASLSLFADKQLLELHLPTGKPGNAGSAAIQQLAEQARGNASLLTLVMLPRLDKATKSTAWFAALERFGISVQIEAVERSALPQWIAQRLGAQGQRVAAGEEGQRTLRFFADRVEGNLLAAHQEIQKLALLFPHQSEVPESALLRYEQVERAVFNVARYNVFKLSEVALTGQMVRLQRMLDGLQAEGVSAVLALSDLAKNIRDLKHVKDALVSGRPLPMALRDQAVWGLRERLFERVLPRLSPATLAQLLWSAHEVDGIAKGLTQPDWPSDGWQALRRLASILCQACSDPLGSPSIMRG